jgi:hypothetical protein
MGKSTVNYNNPMHPWWGGWWAKRAEEPENSRIDRFMQNHERAKAIERHAAFSFNLVWPQVNTHGPLRALNATGLGTPWVPFVPEIEPFPELREEFRQLFERFWKEPV